MTNCQLFLNLLAIILGPVTAVCITLWVQSRSIKKTAKRQLFTSLIAERKGIVISREVANALNTIDVVFSDNPKVVELWHKYYSLLSQQPSEERAHTWLELLSAIATDLGYSNLKQVDLDKFYTPQSHADWYEFEKEIRGEWLRVLKNTERFLVEKREPDKRTIGTLIPPP
jgi:hypothetical protein